MQRLKESPASGRARHNQFAGVRGTPFFIPYRVKCQNIEILGVIHGVRKWPQV